jgi:hypothetical protein
MVVVQLGVIQFLSTVISSVLDRKFDIARGEREV